MLAARFTSTGALDTTFGTNGLVRIDIAGDDDRGRDVVVLPDGRILIAGSAKPDATNINAALYLLDEDGARNAASAPTASSRSTWAGPATPSSAWPSPPTARTPSSSATRAPTPPPATTRWWPGWPSPPPDLGRFTSSAIGADRSPSALPAGSRFVPGPAGGAPAACPARGEPESRRAFAGLVPGGEQ